jgi:hypothetical protein
MRFTCRSWRESGAEVHAILHNLHQCCVAAFFKANDALVAWVNQQP